MTIVGTCHFVSRSHALRYYRGYHYDNVSRMVSRKLREGEIKLGPPKPKQDEQMFVNNEGRYCLES